MILSINIYGYLFLIRLDLVLDLVRKEFQLLQILNDPSIKYLIKPILPILYENDVKLLKLGLRNISKRITSFKFLNIYTPPQHALTRITLFLLK